MIKDIKIDIFASGAQVILHSCNTQNTMGSGIAKALRSRWPAVYEADCLAKTGNYNKLGAISVANIKDDISTIKFVINCYSQEFYGHDKRYSNYEALYNALERVKVFCLFNGNIKTIAAPYKMASNLAGGDWRIVRPMFDVIFGGCDDVDVLICNNT